MPSCRIEEKIKLFIHHLFLKNKYAVKVPCRIKSLLWKALTHLFYNILRYGL